MTGAAVEMRIDTGNVRLRENLSQRYTIHYRSYITSVRLTLCHYLSVGKACIQFCSRVTTGQNQTRNTPNVLCGT
jgi:hypothetical protein